MAKYPYGKVLSAEISLRWNFLTAKLLYGEIFFYGELSRGENSNGEISAHGYL